MRCSQIVSGLNLFFRNAYLLTYFVPFKVVSLGLYAASPTVLPAFEEFSEVSC
jgi:hypothetical protein